MTLYPYVGPPGIAAAVTAAEGAPISSPAELVAWLAATGESIATFTVDAEGLLRVAPRRSEHVACAGGGPVRAAGELEIDSTGAVIAATNQSTGFCPQPSCWQALAAALDRAGIDHPGDLTAAFVFRICAACGQRCIVKDDWFVCDVCGGDL